MPLPCLESCCLNFGPIVPASRRRSLIYIYIYKPALDELWRRTRRAACCCCPSPLDSPQIAGTLPTSGPHRQAASQLTITVTMNLHHRPHMVFSGYTPSQASIFNTDYVRTHKNRYKVTTSRDFFGSDFFVKQLFQIPVDILQNF